MVAWSIGWEARGLSSSEWKIKLTLTSVKLGQSISADDSWSCPRLVEFGNGSH